MLSPNSPLLSFFTRPPSGRFFFAVIQEPWFVRKHEAGLKFRLFCFRSRDSTLGLTQKQHLILDDAPAIPLTFQPSGTT
jgi:hypothetical protein